jgi:hypothetical protein
MLSSAESPWKAGPKSRLDPRVDFSPVLLINDNIFAVYQKSDIDKK